MLFTKDKIDISNLTSETFFKENPLDEFDLKGDFTTRLSDALDYEGCQGNFKILLHEEQDKPSCQNQQKDCYLTHELDGFLDKFNKSFEGYEHLGGMNFSGQQASSSQMPFFAEAKTYKEEKMDDQLSNLAVSSSIDVEKPQQKSRWNKTKDKMLFQLLRTYKKQGVTSIEELYSIKSYEEARTNVGLKCLRKAMNWKQGAEFLLMRIIKKTKKPFSSRETKMLKKLLKECNYENIDCESLCEHFPGKSVGDMELACEKLTKIRKDKCLTKVTKL
ncbi:unnamed protein product [Moneuplotes crassus]|uniref:Uncharacterized protein n=1 Tax=Euplotes crassus TaxID=5936 RepID=A0AAD1TZL2_EUPCR|nr:unnamed protein product [Moneuplotes crassus]